MSTGTAGAEAGADDNTSLSRALPSQGEPLSSREGELEETAHLPPSAARRSSNRTSTSATGGTAEEAPAAPEAERESELPPPLLLREDELEEMSFPEPSPANGRDEEEEEKVESEKEEHTEGDSTVKNVPGTAVPPRACPEAQHAALLVGRPSEK